MQRWFDPLWGLIVGQIMRSVPTHNLTKFEYLKICSGYSGLETQERLGDAISWSHVTSKLAGRSFTYLRRSGREASIQLVIRRLKYVVTPGIIFIALYEDMLPIVVH